jgi:hypothetical protein
MWDNGSIEIKDERSRLRALQYQTPFVLNLSWADQRCWKQLSRRLVGDVMPHPDDENALTRSARGRLCGP